MATIAGTLRQRRDLGKIAGDAFSFYGADWRGFVTIGAATIPLSVAGTLVGGLVEEPAIWIPSSLAILVLSVGVYALVAAAVVAHLLEIDAGAPGDEASAFKAAFARSSDVLRANYRLFFLVLLMGATIVAIPFAIYSAVRWIFATHAIVVDGQISSNALSYSGAMVQGHWWRTFGRTLFIGLIVAALSAAISAIADSAPILLYALLSAITSAFTGPYFSIALTLMYFDLKLRRAEETIPA